MEFSSLIFVCAFLPAVLVLHTLIPGKKVKNALLLIASLLFYAFGEPLCILLMLGSTLANYLLALLLAKRPKKWLLALAVAVNLALLGVFKYADFLLGNVNALFGLSIPLPHIALPIGISFFTFQALSYVIDVYRGEVAAQKNYGKLLLYISFFPQLIAGPIVRYTDIARQIDERSVSAGGIALGLRRFILGLAKKVLISNAMGAAVDHIYGGAPDALSAWIAAIAYLLQIYYDFGGYSDMAIGLGQAFGFTFRENFNYPYIADTVQNFWRRWHISLSSFFKDYVYIPLGGNRRGRLRTVCNRLIVFFLTGLWHGASWNFVVWGLWHGCFLLLESFVPAIQKLPRVLRHLYTLLAVTVGFVFFRAETMPQAFTFLGAMFTGFTFTAESLTLGLQTLTPWFLAMAVCGVLGCGIFEGLTVRLRACQKPWVQAVGFGLALLLLALCIIRLAGGSYNPFIYFRF